MKLTQFPGDGLRQHREALGLSQADVFRMIHVPVSYVRAMEEGDFSAVPSSCYAVGFIRTYCTFLGLEPERYVDSFRACTEPSHRFLRHDPASRRGGSLWVQDAMSWVAICALIAFGWYAYSAVFRPNADANETRVEAGAVEGMQDQPGPVE
jgi:cytoskeletal protein RodZ